MKFFKVGNLRPSSNLIQSKKLNSNKVEIPNRLKANKNINTSHYCLIFYCQTQLYVVYMANERVYFQQYKCLKVHFLVNKTCRFIFYPQLLLFSLNLWLFVSILQIMGCNHSHMLRISEIYQTSLWQFEGAD